MAWNRKVSAVFLCKFLTKIFDVAFAFFKSLFQEI